MKLIFQIDGGIGKCIAATAVCKAIKAQYPDDELIVVSGYPEAFLCNDNVTENLRYNELQYFWQHHINGQKYRIMGHNPYLETAFIEGNTHLVKVWCDMFGIKYNGEQPELFLSDREQTFVSNLFLALAAGKPIMVIQTNGGGKDQPNKYSWTRDLPRAAAQKVVNAFANDYTIFHIRREDQPPLENVKPITTEFRALFGLIQLSEKRLFIDSFTQHAAAALGKPSAAFFINKTVAMQFGYDMHTHIIGNPATKKPELKHAYLNQFNITGIPTEFPYRHEGEIVDADRVIEAVKGEKKEEAIEEAKPEQKTKSQRKEKIEMSEN